MHLHRYRMACGVAAAIATLAVGLFVFLGYRFPPLRIAGGVFGISGHGEIAVGWDLVNSGWFPAHVDAVTIEGYEGVFPGWTVGAASPGGRMVGSGMSLHPEQDGYILQPLGNFTVPPAWRLPKEGPSPKGMRTNTIPYLYGLITMYSIGAPGSHAVAKRITIRYRYLGLPMTSHYSP